MQNNNGINSLTSYFLSLICLTGLFVLGGCAQESNSRSDVSVSSGQGTKGVKGYYLIEIIT